MSEIRNISPKLSRRRFLGIVGSALGGGAIGASASGCSGQGGVGTDATSSMPLYVDDGPGWPVFRGPYLQREAHITAFLLPADIEPLKRLCDRYLNAPQAGRQFAGRQFDYAPLAPYVMLLFADMIISSLDARDQALGWMRETEASFWLPTLARAQAGGLLVPDHIAWFLPYLFVDNPYAIATGREVYGFPKTLGRFERPAGGRESEFALDVWGFAQPGPQVECRWQRLLEVRRSGVGGEAVTWDSWDEARAALVRMLLGSAGPGAGEAGAKPLLDLNSVEMPLVFLKQFRAVADTRRACYQAVVEAPARVQVFHKGGALEGVHRLTFYPLQSHPLPQKLGLSPGRERASAQDVEALAAFRLQVDFRLEHGVEIWRA